MVHPTRFLRVTTQGPWHAQAGALGSGLGGPAAPRGHGRGGALALRGGRCREHLFDQGGVQTPGWDRLLHSQASASPRERGWSSPGGPGDGSPDSQGVAGLRHSSLKPAGALPADQVGHEGSSSASGSGLPPASCHQGEFIPSPLQLLSEQGSQAGVTGVC